MDVAVLTLGVDLASQDIKTAVCTIRWFDHRAEVRHLKSGVDNHTIVDLMAEADATGIDAPFGWPARFLAAIAAWNSDGRWAEPWDADTVRLLRLRETDRWIQSQTRKWPLSVSADSIAVCAMRAAALLSAATAGGPEMDRLDGPYFEVYPGAALIAWNLAGESVRYKKDRDARAKLMEALAPTDGWLELSDEVRGSCIHSDHALDALLAGLVARAAATGRTHAPPKDLDVATVVREGWIHLPPTELDQLPHDPARS